MMEMEIEKLKLELKIFKVRAGQGVTLTEGASRTGGSEVLRYAQTVRGVLSIMPESEPLVPSWFSVAETMFASFQVLENIRRALIMPFLTEKMRAVASRVGEGVMPEYTKLKETILQELQLSPAEYRDMFYTSRKLNDESWGQFAARLGDILEYYLKGCEINSMEDFKQLFVADRIKRVLSPNTRAYVELNETKGWLTPQEVANLVIKYT